MVVWSILPILTTIIGSVITMFILGLWQYAVFLVIYAILFAVVVFTISRLMITRNREEAAASNKTSGSLADMVTNVMTVKAFGREGYEDKQAREVIGEWHHRSNRLKWSVIGATSAFSTMYAIGATAAFIFAVLGTQYGIATIGMLYLVFIYALNINRQLWDLNNITRTYNRVIGDADEMATILLTDNRLVDRSNEKLSVKRGEITLKDVSFAHDGGKGQQTFKKFNLTVPAGQRIGLVGHSGSGKTTLTRILLRFSDIDSGDITIDGKNIANVTQQSLHESIAYVAQEPMLFHRSLSENISYADQTQLLKKFAVPPKKRTRWSSLRAYLRTLTHSSVNVASNSLAGSDSELLSPGRS